MLKIVFAALAVALLVRPVAPMPLDWSALALPDGDAARFDESSVPAGVRRLLGRPITLRGYMHPGTPAATNIERFLLGAEVVGEVQKLKKDVPLHQYVIVEMQGEARADFFSAPIVVTGVLGIDVVRDADGKTICIYKLKAKSAVKTSRRRGYQSVWDQGGC